MTPVVRFDILDKICVGADTVNSGGAMGYDNPADLFSRCALGLKNFDEIYQPLLDRQLLSNEVPDVYRQDWLAASSARF